MVDSWYCISQKKKKKGVLEMYDSSLENDKHKYPIPSHPPSKALYFFKNMKETCLKAGYSLHDWSTSLSIQTEKKEIKQLLNADIPQNNH